MSPDPTQMPEESPTASNTAPLQEAGAQDAGDLDDDEGGGLRLHVSIEEKVEIARQVATRIFDLLGAGVPAIDVAVEEEQIVVRLTDVAASLTPAGDTRVLESVQFILSKAVNRYALKRTRLSIDAEGFRRRRPEGLDKVAQALAQKVVRLGKPIAIGPLSQGDLRFLTAQLTRGGQGVQVQTVGTADRRRLVILPAVPVSTAASAGPDGEGEETGSQGGGEGRRRRRRRR